MSIELHPRRSVVSDTELEQQTDAAECNSNGSVPQVLRCKSSQSGAYRCVKIICMKFPRNLTASILLGRFRSGKIVMQTAVTPTSAPAANDALMTMEHARTYLFEGLLRNGAG